MLGYYPDLAFRGLRRNVALTALMVAVVGFGIGASMTVLTTLRALALDPIPGKSSRLFVPLINARRPSPDTLTYSDAMALMKAHQALRQSAMFGGLLVVSAAGEGPFPVGGRAAYGDFFRMFAVPFRSGGPWSQADDDGGSNVVVLSAKLADRLFPHADAVGKTINLSAHDYRVIGVTQQWNPAPRFYDLGFGTGLDGPDDVFLPFSTAVNSQMERPGPLRCSVVRNLRNEEYATIPCYWVQFWVELPTAAAARAYKAFLYNFAAQRQQVGHFNWPLRVDLPNLRSWLALQIEVPDTLRVSSVVAFGFLVVCLINAAGLMLARFSARAGELGVRRALGASRWDICLQCLVETAVVGLPAGLVGLGLTAAGLATQRSLHMIAGSTGAVARVTSLDGDMMVITLVLAVCATLCSALYAVWRASLVQPAWQLKTQ